MSSDERDQEKDRDQILPDEASDAHPAATPEAREILLRASAGKDDMPAAIRALHAIDALLADPILSISDRTNAVTQVCGPYSGDLIRLAVGLGRSSAKRASDLPGIVTRFGLLGLRRMIELVASRSLFRADHPPIARLMSQVWWHSLARAEAMRLVSDRVEVPRRWLTGNLYTAGLFADVGATFLFWLVDQARLPAGTDDEPTAPTLDLIGDHHEWVGEDMLRRWGMADEVARMAGNHHGRWSGVGPPFWPIAAIAEQIADEIVPLPFSVAHVRERPERASHFIAVGVDERRRLIFAVRKQVDAFRAALDAGATDPDPASETPPPGDR